MSNSPTKPTSGSILLGSTAVLTIAIAVGAMLIPADGVRPLISTAQAQGIALDVQFRTALAPHGRWQRHDRWGEVWTPSRRDRDWRPYTAGHWVYTDEWGWYWDSDEDFGWVTYHYGNWVLDQRLGWIWIPGNEWGPAWVQWRRGDRHAGWAPLPPRQVVYDYDDDPDYWVFVSFNNFTSPNVRRVILPPRERVVVIRETVVVNRTVIVDRGPRIAVNPGIEPTIVAARIGRPIRVANVRPVVVAGTVGVQSAVEIRGDDKRGRERVRAQVTEKSETIAPAKEVPPPQALKKGEEGKLGERAPTAAREGGQQPAGAKGQPDTTKGPDTAKGQPDATKAPDTAKDAGKAKTDDTAKAKDAGKAKDTAKSPADTKAEPKSQVKDTTKTDPTAGAKAKSDDLKTKDAAGAKSKADDFARPKSDEKSKQPATAMPKAEPKQSPPPEVKQQSAPKGPEPKQPTAAPQQPKEQPRAAAPQSPPPGAGGPKQEGPKGPPAAKDKGDEKGKGN